MLKSIGSDMELFAKNKSGQHIALCGKIGGTKEEPLQLADMDKGFMIQEDNVAFEFNIPVCATRQQFVNSFAMMRDKIETILNHMNLTMAKESSVSFDKNELTHPNALVFGCEPDYDAWKMVENQKPQAQDANLRTAGGHIHVGTDVDMIKGIQYMDLFLGVPSILLDDNEASKKRRELYGKAGAMRPKPYGFEYRVLSNFWMFSDSLTSWVYEQTYKAMNFSYNFSEKEGNRICYCINNGDKKEAEALISSYGITLPI